MAIKKIIIENFTVFNKIEIDFCEGINVLIGENGTGKTHLLKLLYALNTLHSSNYLINIQHLFGQNFRANNCWLRLNDEQARPWNVKATDEAMKKPETHISAAIENKRPGMYIPVTSFLSISDITRVVDEYGKNIDIDYTQVEIVRKAENKIPENIPALAKTLVRRLEDEIGGTVHFDEADKSFWVHKSNGEKIPYTAEAEGYKKLGLLWRLMMNKSIVKDTILFWDEPEASLNPALFPVFVDVLVELAKNGVQIFLATHEYNLMKYFSMKRQTDDQVAFINFCKTDNGVVGEREDEYNLLEYNAIVEANIKLLEDDIEGVF
jgi:AAA15 family ATPase/GTPase